ncbi:MAG: LCP family protein [Chloroflexi bacterium]|nr:LCP family protein [Chloroflexota bacterium]
MAVEKQRRGSRVARLVFARLLPLVLIIAIAVVLVGVAQNLLRYLGEQSEATSRRPAYAATATAIAEITPEGDVKLNLAKLFEPPAQDITFATNTPQAVVEPTMPPTPDITSTPRPLPTLFVYQGPDVVEANGTAVPTPVEAVDRHGMDLLNIVLLGHDGELTNDGFIRTDTMIIVSINRTAGTVSMLSLPRDLFVYIPGWTMQRLNLAYIHGESIGWTGGGFGLLRQTIFYNFGINVHYYAMVNLSGFRAVVDAVGGVDLAVDCAIENLPLIGADVPASAYRSDEVGNYVLPVGYYHMTGGEALWYARSRDNSSDFDRGRRQQQVLRAVLRRARDQGLFNNIIPLWNEGSQYVETNLAIEDLLSLVPLALNMDSTRIESFNLQRLYHTTPWTTADGENVQLPNYEPIRQTLVDFYSPATDSQLVSEGSSIRVQNGTANADWDRVAAERLAWDGFNPMAAGAADRTDYTDTVLIDYTGRSKGSSLEQIAHTLNVRPENIRLEPNANREYDFDVILGSNYNSCTVAGVLPVGG